MNPYMPHADLVADFAAHIAMARQISSGTTHVPSQGSEPRSVAIITPGRLIMPIPCPPAGAVTPQMLADIRKIVPQEPKLVITVIAFNDIVRQRALTPGEINSHIPFLGILVGMVFDGHNVVVFEGHPSALQIGCDKADLLIVDQPRTEFLQNDWVSIATSVMKTPRILIFGRDGSIGTVDPASQPFPQAEFQDLRPYTSTIIVSQNLAPQHDLPQPVHSLGSLRAAAMSLLLSSGLAAGCGLIFLPGMIRRFLDFLTAAGQVPQDAIFIPMLLASYPIFIGAWNMHRGTRYRWAYAAAVLACIPVLTPAFCFSIPFGIWALIVLHRRDVKEAFTRNAENQAQKIGSHEPPVG